MKKQYIYAGVSVLAWSTLAPFTKLLLSSMPNFQVLFICSLIAALFLFVVNVATGNIKKMRAYKATDYIKMAGLGVLGLFLYMALYNTGLANLTAQQACVANYLWPIMTVIFSCIILKEKMTVMKAVAMLCSFIGIVILTSGVDVSASQGGAVIGIISCLIAAACYGLFSVLNNKVDYDLKISMMIAWGAAAVLSLPLGLIFEEWVPVVGAQWLGYLWLGVIGDGLAYLTWAIALKGTKNTATIANLAYLTPFMSLSISAVLLKEGFDPRAIVALVFIIGGILVQSIVAARKR